MAQSRVKIGQNRLKIAQNRPKIGLRGQNGHCQNTAHRKQRPYTPQGRSGWHTCAAFGPGYQIWPQRGLKAPFAAKFGMDLGVLAVFLGPVCHQMHSKFGSEWGPKASLWPKFGTAQRPQTYAIHCAPAGYLVAASGPLCFSNNLERHELQTLRKINFSLC